MRNNRHKRYVPLNSNLKLIINYKRATTRLVLAGVVRDFSSLTHPDFEATIASEKNLVMTTLSDDLKPQLNRNRSPVSTTLHGENWFNMWFRDVPNINKR